MLQNLFTLILFSCCTETGLGRIENAEQKVERFFLYKVKPNGTNSPEACLKCRTHMSIVAMLPLRVFVPKRQTESNNRIEFIYCIFKKEKKETDLPRKRGNPGSQ